MSARTTNAVVAQRRLSAQRLLGNPAPTALDAVQCLGAMQAQDYAQAVMAIGARTAGATIVEIERAILDRSILRTWPMRGTMHFVPARDAGWMVSLGATRRLTVDAPRRRELELDVAVLDRCEAVVRDLLHDAGAVARPQVLLRLEQAGVRTTAQRGYHILLWLAQRGVICLGPMVGKQPGIALLEEWVPNAHALSRPDALTTLATRYFTSHGPATIHDFAHWTGLTMADVRAAHESIRASLVMDTVHGIELWASAEVMSRATDAPQPLLLLPGFDEYLLGYRDRGAQITPENQARIAPGNNGVFRPMLVEHGEVTGRWSREYAAGGVRFGFEFFALGRRSRKVMTAAAERMAAVMEKTLTGVVSTVG